LVYCTDAQKQLHVNHRPARPARVEQQRRVDQMKKFEVEFRRHSYIIVTVEAKSKDEAIDKAWEELDNNYEHGDIEDASWDVESIEEIDE